MTEIRSAAATAFRWIALYFLLGVAASLAAALFVWVAYDPRVAQLRERLPGMILYMFAVLTGTGAVLGSTMVVVGLIISNLAMLRRLDENAKRAFRYGPCRSAYFWSAPPLVW